MTGINAKLEHFCGLSAGYIWTEQDSLDIVQLRSDLIANMVEIQKSLEGIHKRILRLPE